MIARLELLEVASANLLRAELNSPFPDGWVHAMTTDSMKTFYCKECAVRVVYSLDKAGVVFVCPKCGTANRLPGGRKKTQRGYRLRNGQRKTQVELDVPELFAIALMLAIFLMLFGAIVATLAMP